MKFFKELLSLVFCCCVVNAAVIVHNNSTSNVSAVTDVPQESTTLTLGQLAVQRWMKTEKGLKEMTKDLVKKILPFMMREMEDMNISTECTRHLIKLISGIKQTKLWAFKMLDASGKLPNGVLSGTITSLGDYDECLDVDIGHFQGMYCSVLLSPPLPERRRFVPVHEIIPELVNFTRDDSVVSELIRNAQHYYYLSFRSSVCMPSTCTREDVESIAVKLVKTLKLEWDVTVPSCEAKTPLVFDSSQIVILCVFGLFLFVAGLGTSLDVYKKLTSKEKDYKKDSGVFLQCLYCFSLYSNTLRLVKKDTSPDSIKIFHGMKVITVMWVILNHNYYYVKFEVFGSLLNTRYMANDMAFQFVLNGFLNVETFFFISAVLVVYGRMKAKDKDFTMFIYIFRRIWRLTPPFMFLIAFVFLMEHMGSGPMWKETVGVIVDNCRKNWWTNLLYFNNLIGSANMCMQWSWYIPVDTHLYFLAFFVLLPIKTRPKIGFLVIGLIFTVCITLTAGLHVYFKLHPTAIYSFSHPDDINYFVDYGYFRTYLHAVTYCVGMVVGYIIYSRPKMQIPIVVNVIGWIVAMVMALTVLYGVYEWNMGNTPSLTVSTIYQCTNKLVWALALGWVTVTCYTGNGGAIASLLGWQGFVPLSRLTYMAYLVHPLTQHMYAGSVRRIMQAEHRTMVFLFLGHIVAAYIGAFVFSQLFESPFMALEKVMFAKRYKAAMSATNEEHQDGERKGKPVYVPRIETNGIHALKISKYDLS